MELLVCFCWRLFPVKLSPFVNKGTQLVVASQAPYALYFLLQLTNN